MSELKARHIVDVYDSFYAENPFGERSQVYLKSEADKVIDGLKNEIEKQKQLRDMALSSVPNVLKVMKIIQHHKYKRCLAMAEEWRNYAAFCGMQSSCHNRRGFGKTAEKYTWKEIHAWKCVHRFKELAEKFKEAK